MRRLTRIMTLIMAVLLTVVIGTVSVNAATYSGTFGENGDNLTWEYDDQTNTLTISGTGEMEDWPAGYATPWGSYQMEITTVVINDGVTNIGKEAFSNCHALTSVTLPNSVTDIRFHGFQGSENLASIDLPDNLTTIGGAAFYGCHALTDVTIPDSVTTMEDSVFANCGNLTNVVIGKNVKSIDYQTFYNTNIASIEIPKSVSAIYTQAFARTKIQEITIPRSVTELGGGIFNDCDNIYGVKEASGSIDKCVDLLAHEPRLVVVSGEDAINYPILSNSGKGVISVTANLLPDYIANLTNFAMKNEFLKAKEINDDLYAINKILFCESNPIPIKAAMFLAGLIDTLEYRLPLCEPSSENLKKIESVMKQYNIKGF